MPALVVDLLSFTRGAVRQPDLQHMELPPIVEKVIAQENDRSADEAMEIPPARKS